MRDDLTLISGFPNGRGVQDVSNNPTVLIAGPFRIAIYVTESLFQNSASDTGKIEGFTFKGSRNGINIFWANKIRISSNVFSNMETGISWTKGKQIEIEENSFIGNTQSAVWVGGALGYTPWYCLIALNTFEGNIPAISVNTGGAVYISQNSFKDNHRPSMVDGASVALFGNSYAYISDNIFTGHIGSAIYSEAFGTLNPTVIVHNIITQTSGCAIFNKSSSYPLSIFK